MRIILKSLALAYASIRWRWVSSLLSVAAFGAGVSLVMVIFLLSQAIENGIARNASGVDVVIGAKGSPLQLVLSSVYHVDIPTGNISQEEAERLARHPQIESAIPLALGDNYKGWRIVGTNEDYLELYSADVVQGEFFKSPFEAVAGAATGLRVGETFAGAHGFSENGDVHDEHLYTITGILDQTGTVLDRLIVTSVDSVQALHAHHHEAHHHDHDKKEASGEITALLVQVRSPMAVMNLPREINRSSNVMAASPAFEMTRLLRNLGFSRAVLNVIATAFVGLAFVMLMALLAAGLSARRYDIAVLRVLGASITHVAGAVIFEGMILGVAGALIGVITGHIISYVIVLNFNALSGIVLPYELIIPGMIDVYAILGGMIAGMLAGGIPALMAARTDIASVLARVTI
jgi:putative ABC transport system permease protein